jgi:hypothetical protein
MKTCEGIGAEDGAFGLGIGEPCENGCYPHVWTLALV